MKRIVKSLIALILVLSVLFSFAGCSATFKAESAVKGMFRAFKRLDFEAAEKYVDVDAFELSALGEDLSGNTRLFMRFLFHKLDYKILSSQQIDENTVDVEVEVTAVALGPILLDFAGPALKYQISSAFADPKPTEKEMEKKMEEIMKDVLLDKDLKTNTSTVTIQVKQEDGQWRVEAGSTLVDAVFGGVMDTVGQIADIVAGLKGAGGGLQDALGDIAGGIEDALGNLGDALGDLFG